MAVRTKTIGTVMVDENRTIRLPEEISVQPRQTFEVFQVGDEIRLRPVNREQLVLELASLLHEGLAGMSYEKIKAERLREDAEWQKKIDAWIEASKTRVG